MQIKDFTLNRAKSSFEVVKGTVNNKTAPTSENIIVNLSQVLYDLHKKSEAERETVTENE